MYFVHIPYMVLMHVVRANTVPPILQMGKWKPREEKSNNSNSHSKSEAELASGLSRASFHRIPPAHKRLLGAACIPRSLVTGKETSAVPLPMLGRPS